MWLGTQLLAFVFHPSCCAEGRLQLASVDAEAGVSGDEVLALAAAAERNTRHPLADALVAAAEARGEAGERGLRGEHGMHATAHAWDGCSN